MSVKTKPVDQKDRKTEAKPFEFPVEVTLTDRELLALGDEMATLDAEMTAVENRHTVEKTKFKEDVARVDLRTNHVIQRLRTKKETRPTLCWNDFDFEAGICTIRRHDTDEIVKTRRMEAAEYKRPLPFKPLAAVETEDAASESPDGLQIGDEVRVGDEVVTVSWIGESFARVKDAGGEEKSVQLSEITKLEPVTA